MSSRVLNKTNLYIHNNWTAVSKRDVNGEPLYEVFVWDIWKLSWRYVHGCSYRTARMATEYAAAENARIERMFQHNSSRPQVMD